MKILSIDSSSTCCTCSILEDNKLLGEIIYNDKKQHSIILLSQIDSLLENLNLDIANIDAFVVSEGPGSFTGLRIGLATAKGLAQGLNKPIVGVSTLDCLAYNIAFFDGIICPIMDALRDNVYTSIYKFSGENLERTKDYMAIHIDELIQMLKEHNEPKLCFVGDATYKFKEKLLNSFPNSYFAPANLNVARASSLGELGIKKLLNGEQDNLFTFSPIYIRKSQAEREYENKIRMVSNE